MPTVHRYVLVDVFTERALEGNPLAVFTNARGLTTERMQALARELNLSGTAFVLPARAGGHARVRVFTPVTELPFAGHPTLGTALVLGGPLEAERLVLELEIGSITVELVREGHRVVFGWIQCPEPRQGSMAPEQIAAVLQALGVKPAGAIGVYESGPRHVCVPVSSQAAIAALEPNLSELARVTGPGLLVSVFHHDGAVCKTRVFAPASGVAEDPATGSAAGPVALHLVQQGQLALGQELLLSQGSEIGRPSRLHALVDARGGGFDVRVGGSAVVVARGEFHL